MNKYNLKISELFDDIPDNLRADFESVDYAWEIIPKIKDVIAKIIKNPDDGYAVLSEGVLVGKNVKIAKTATIIPPAVIGNDVEIRPGAYIRGNVYIGDRCVVGNSSELKNCILLTHVQAPHYNYVGDSILGYKAHMGAGAITSNFRSDHGNVTLHGPEIATGLRKFGAMLGDEAEIGCGSVLNPGTIVGRGSIVYPLSSVRGIVAEKTIYKRAGEVVAREER